VTSFIPAINEIRLLGVFDAGIPGKERVVLKVEADIDIGWYAIILSSKTASTGHAIPIRDSMYWVGSGIVSANDWIFLFTGSGTKSTVPAADGKAKLFLEYWGRPQTIFHDPRIIPVLWRLSGIVVERSGPPQTPFLPK